MILRIILSLVGLFFILVACLLIYAFAVPRPLDTTDPSIFLEDGKIVNYCDLPELDGSSKLADDIPKAYTPGCGLTKTPMPILENCTEPLADGVVDMRGLWYGLSGRIGHLERIEQCGNRVVVTAYGTIHDFRVDGLTPEILAGFIAKGEWKMLLNKRSTTFRNLPDDIKNNLTDEVMFAAVLEQPTLLKRPLLPLNGELNLGFKADQYQNLFAK